MQNSIAKIKIGLATLGAIALLSSSSAFAGGQSLRNDCKLDKLGNGPRHCQCEALRHHLLPKKVLWRLNSMHVCDVIQTGNGGQGSSHPSDDCDTSDQESSE